MPRIACFSDHKNRSNPAARSPEISGLALIEARGHQKHLTVIGIEPNVHLARLERFVDPDHALGNLIVGTFFPVRPVKLVPVPVLIRPTDK